MKKHLMSTLSAVLPSKHKNRERPTDIRKSATMGHKKAVPNCYVQGNTNCGDALVDLKTYEQRSSSDESLETEKQHKLRQDISDEDSKFRIVKDEDDHSSQEEPSYSPAECCDVVRSVEYVNTDGGAGCGAAGAPVPPTRTTLHTSGLYHRGVFRCEAIKLLRGKPTGTYLVHETTKSEYEYVVTVKTDVGTTSIRVSYRYGGYYIRNPRKHCPQTNVYACVLDLIQALVNKDGIIQKDPDAFARELYELVLIQPLYCR